MHAHMRLEQAQLHERRYSVLTYRMLSWRSSNRQILIHRQGWQPELAYRQNLVLWYQNIFAPYWIPSFQVKAQAYLHQQ